MTNTRSSTRNKKSYEKTTPKKVVSSYDGGQFRLDSVLGRKLMQRLKNNENGCKDMKPAELMQHFRDFSNSGIPTIKWRNAVARAKVKLGEAAECSKEEDGPTGPAFYKNGKLCLQKFVLFYNSNIFFFSFIFYR